MRTLSIMLCASFLLSVTAVAQKTNDSVSDDEIKTIFPKGHRSKGGYGSLMAGYTQINGKDGFCYGFTAARLLGHSLAMGIAGSGFSNDYFLDHFPGSNYMSLQGGYGGFFIEPIIVPKFPVHVSFPLLLGLGGVAKMDAYYWGDFEYEYYYEETGFFFVAEPGIDIELNLVKHLRLGLGAKYRVTTNSHIEGLGADALNGYSFCLSLKFGKF